MYYCVIKGENKSLRSMVKNRFPEYSGITILASTEYVKSVFFVKLKNSKLLQVLYK
jgi:hypothetical protein